jgi:hypothetical protein
VPDSRFVHLYVAKGAVTLEASTLRDHHGSASLIAGDAVRLYAAGSPRLTADPGRGAEVLIWQMEH